MSENHSEPDFSQPTRFEEMLLSVMQNGSEEDLLHVLLHFPEYLIEIEDYKELNSVLSSSMFLEQKIKSTNIDTLINDFPSDYTYSAINTIKKALQLSRNHLLRDPSQLPIQLIGRLLQDERFITKRLLYQANSRAQNSLLKPVKTFREHALNPLVSTIALGGNGISTLHGIKNATRVVTKRFGGTIVVVDFTTSQVKIEIPNVDWDKGNRSQSYIISKDNRFIFTYSTPNASMSNEFPVIRMHNLESGKLEAELTDSPEPPFLVYESKFNNTIVMSTKSDTLYVWDYSTKTLQYSSTGTIGRIENIFETQNGTYLVLHSKVYNNLKVVDIHSNTILLDLPSESAVMQETVLVNEKELLVSFSLDPRQVNMWDIKSGVKLYSTPVETSVVDFTLSNNPERFLATHYFGAISMWNTNTGALISEIPGHDYKLDVLFETQDASLIATTTIHPEDNTVKVWDSLSGTLVYELTGHRKSIGQVLEVPNKAMFVTTSRDGTIRFWDKKDGKQLAYFEVYHPESVGEVLIDKSGTYLLMNTSSSIKVWNIPDIPTIAFSPEEFGHRARVERMVYSPQLQYAITASNGEKSDNTIKFWDILSGTLIKNLDIHTSRIQIMALHMNANTLITVEIGNMSKVYFWDIKTQKLAYEMNIPENQSISNIFEIPHTDCVFMVGYPDYYIFNVRTKYVEHTINREQLNPLHNSYEAQSVYNNTLFVRNTDNELVSIDVISGEVKVMLEKYDVEFRKVIETSDEMLTITIGWDKNIHVFETKTQDLVFKLNYKDYFISDFRESKTGNFLIAMYYDENDTGLIGTWDLATGKVLAEIPTVQTTKFGLIREVPEMEYVLVTPRSNAYLGKANHTITAFDCRTGELAFTLKGHSGGVTEIIGIKHTNILLTTGNDGYIRLWDMVSQQEISATFVGDYIQYVVFDEVVRRVAVGTISGEVLFFEVEGLVGEL